MASTYLMHRGSTSSTTTPRASATRCTTSRPATGCTTVAHGVRHNLEAFRDAGGPSPRLVAVGGGTRGGLWTRIVSDVTGQEQHVPVDTTGAALGDALLAAQALGVAVDAQAWNPIVATVTPDPERTARYDAFHEHYRALYPATADAAHFLAEEQRRADG